MEIDVATAKRWMDSAKDDHGKSVYFLDCREPAEHQVARIEGVKLTPMSRWPPSQEVIDAMQDKQVVVSNCGEHGRRDRSLEPGDRPFGSSLLIRQGY